MEKYIGTKIIDAEPMTKDGVEGYKVVYNNPNNTKYESWSPKDVFEDAYIQIDKDNKNTKEVITQMFLKANDKFGKWMPQEYVNIFLSLCEENGITTSVKLKDK